MNKTNVEEIVMWLNKCNASKVEPWLWDFKNELLKNHDTAQNENAIIRIFEWYMDKDVKYKLGETEETSLAKSIYSLLWNIEVDVLEKKRLDMDVMNSFWITYKQGIYLRYGEKYHKWKDGKINADAFSSLIESYSTYSRVNELFLCFAELTHTIGNFTVEPKGFNTGRKGNDYWDHALCLLRETEPLGHCFKHYVDKYFMTQYVYSDYTVASLYGKEAWKIALPSDIEMQDFLTLVCDKIEKRGKHMIRKICEKIIENDMIFQRKPQEWFFYNDIMNDSNATLNFVDKSI